VLHFIQEIQYSSELEQIEPDPGRADEISRSVEVQFSLVGLTISAYGFLRFKCCDHQVLVWYSTDGSTVSLLSIKTC
jgi:hypothetical protein